MRIVRLTKKKKYKISRNLWGVSLAFWFWSILSFPPAPAPRDWDCRFLSKTGLQEGSQDSNHAPPKLHGKVGAVTPLCGCIQWPTPTTYTVLGQPIPFLTNSLTPKDPAGYPPASGRPSRTGDCSKAKAKYSPGWGEKMDLSRRQVITAHLTGIWEKKGVFEEEAGGIWNRSRKIVVALSEVTDLVNALLRRWPVHRQGLREVSVHCEGEKSSFIREKSFSLALTAELLSAQDSLHPLQSSKTKCVWWAASQ